MDRLDKEEYVMLDGEFYSDDTFDFHPAAEDFDMLTSDKITLLGSNIATFGQKDTIDLYEGKILDGRNRYLACKEFGITPRYRHCHLPKGEEPEDYVESKNYNRRHLTSAQQADYAWKRAGSILKKAKKRKLSTLKQFNNHKVTDVPSEGTTVENGKVIEILAKRYGVSKNTLAVSKKVRKLNDPEVNNKWKEARKGKSTIRDVAKLIREKYPPKKPKAKLETKLPQIKENPELTKKLKAQLNMHINEPAPELSVKVPESPKKQDSTIKDASRIAECPIKEESPPKTKEDVEQFVNEINKNIVQKFTEKLSKSRDNNPEIPIEDKENQCQYCSKATVLAISHQYNCEGCGHIGYTYIPKVICDVDIINGERKLRNPTHERCEDSFLEDEVYT